MKVLTAAEMREVDRLTIELGIPGIILMENAGHSVVEEMVRQFGPMSRHRVTVICGKGNNGGDGLVIARILAVRHKPAALHVMLTHPEDELTGDAAANLRMLKVSGVAVQTKLPSDAAQVTVVVDAVLGTGIMGPAHGAALDAIRAINSQFPQAKVVAVDIPSGMASDVSRTEREFARADLTVTFTAPKPCHVFPPNCDSLGALVVKQIGSPGSLMDSVKLAVSGPDEFAGLFAARPKGAHKGSFGHVLLIGGAAGKTGSIKMSGLSALRIGAGLVTVASEAAELAPDLMTQNLWDAVAVINSKNVIAIGPGLAMSQEVSVLLRRLLAAAAVPMVIDADALNLLTSIEWKASQAPAVLTPHPGEMGRLLGLSVGAVEADRLGAARRLAADRNCIAVLKGQRTLIALPDGFVWVNPTGSPAMAKGGSGDVLTGLIAGLIAQHPKEVALAVCAAVYLHGLCGQLGAQDKTEQCLLASELIDYLPGAIRALQPV